MEVAHGAKRTLPLNLSLTKGEAEKFFPTAQSMKFSHTEENRDGRHLDVLTDEENGLRIVVSRLGAELISLARINEAGNWIGFLYRDGDLSVPDKGGQK